MTAAPAAERAAIDRNHCLTCGLPIRIDDRGAWTHAPGAPESPISKS